MVQSTAPTVDEYFTELAPDRVDADQITDLTLALLDRREPGATICPSEVARLLATDATNKAGESADWRSAMPLVHAAIDRLVSHGQVQLTWKGKALEARAGPYRIGKPVR